jgi:2-polyprenyl-6-methoxyphenol hydroxylase-like FAD-dependent oxidoreductase
MNAGAQPLPDHDDSQVIVVGAGPVGLWLACELALAGVDVTVLERSAQRSPYSRALGLHARTIEVLAMRGMQEPFLADGIPVSNWHFGLLPSRPDLRPLDTPYPFMLAYPQERTEHLMETRAAELGVRIRRGHAVNGLTQDDSSVTVDVTGPSGNYTLSAPFLVGCDGAGSTVRKAAGIDFPGTDASVFGYLGDVMLDDPPSSGPVNLNGPEGALIVVPVPGGRYRVTGYDPANQDPSTPLTLDELRATTIRVAGTDFGMRDPVWLSRFSNATRIAAAYRDRRVLLAGDAAHMHFPAGGVGLNVGVQDAMNLGWKLAAEVTGRASAGLLDTYHAERHPVGMDLAEHTLAQTALLVALSPEGAALRSLMSHLIDTQPAMSLALAEKLSGLEVAYGSLDPTAHALVGRRAPDLDVFGHLHDGRPVLLTMSEEAAEQASSPDIRTCASSLADSGRPEWSGVLAAIIRPDGHVWWAFDRSVADLASALKEAMADLPASF